MHYRLILFLITIIAPISVVAEEVDIKKNSNKNSTPEIEYYEEAYDVSEFELEEIEQVNDPYEPVNRQVYEFNKVVDELALKPAAHTYRYLVPVWGQDMIGNFLFNLTEPVNLANAILQGDPDKVAHISGRFMTNTIYGLGGVFDVASTQDLEKMPEDFGKTMHHYGFGIGPYIMLPLLGPSSGRDAPALAVDYFLDPFGYTYIVHRDLIIARRIADTIDKRESVLDATDHISETAIDEYSTVRSIYLQKRKFE